MAGKHSINKYEVKKKDDHFIVIISASGAQVPGTATYEVRSEAQKHADDLNDKL